MKHSEIESHAAFSIIRYAQVWEDADILVSGLDVHEGDVCLSIASAGDNALGLLTRNPARVVALDLNPVQLACLELRVAAYRTLEHHELLGLMGSRPWENRHGLYLRCRPLLSAFARDFWDSQRPNVDAGIGTAGKFERYFSLFRERMLPFVHSKSTVHMLLQHRERPERERFYEESWNSWRWRLLFKLFFSRTVMGWLGRDPSFFRYVEGSVADRILLRTKHALVELDPACNPYLHWILKGTHGDALPLALRRESFDLIRNRLDKLEWGCQSLEQYLASYTGPRFTKFNLSDIFEYMSPENYAALLSALCAAAAPGARFAYWNMLAPRSRPESLATHLRPLTEEASRLFREDKAFFYSAFIIEEKLGL